MEIKRKLMTNEQLSEKEAALTNEITAVRDENAERFKEIGYELDLAFESKTDDDYDYSQMSSEGEKSFPVGYVSRAVLTIKRPKTEEDKESEKEIIEENEKEAEELGAEASGSEADETPAETDDVSEEQQKNDETLKASEEELERSVAFTRVMLIRVYRAFWVEKISVCDDDGIAQLRADLDEFYTGLADGTALSGNPE